MNPHHPPETSGIDQIAGGRLHLDVTAVLLAVHLGILDVVEQTYWPLQIPPSLTAALVHMRDELAAHQPNRVVAQRQVLRLLEQGALTAVTCTASGTWDQHLVDDLGDATLALISEAQTFGGYVLEYRPLRVHDLNDGQVLLPNDLARLLVACPALAESLRQHGPLSDDSY